MEHGQPDATDDLLATPTALNFAKKKKFGARTDKHTAARPPPPPKVVSLLGLTSYLKKGTDAARREMGVGGGGANVVGAEIAYVSAPRSPSVTPLGDAEVCGEEWPHLAAVHAVAKAINATNLTCNLAVRAAERGSERAGRLRAAGGGQQSRLDHENRMRARGMYEDNMSVDLSAFERHISEGHDLLLESSNAGKVRGQGDMSSVTDSQLHETRAERCHERNGAHELTNSLEARSGGGGGALLPGASRTRSARSRVLKGVCGACGQGVFGDEARQRDDRGVKKKYYYNILFSLLPCILLPSATK